MSLNIENLSFSYDCREVLKDISFQAAEKEMLAVIGPNGVGKSTLFRCILGILREYSGKIKIGQNDIQSMKKKDLAKCMAYIPQAHRPTFGYTVMDTVLMGTTRFLSPFEQPKEVHKNKAMKALKMVGMEAETNDEYGHLSGGQKQLVLIARALAQDAEILLMDEPTSALDFGNQWKVLDMMKELSLKGYCIILSTHNPQHALYYADKVMALASDKSYIFGKTKEVLTPKLIKKIYGVDVDVYMGKK